MKVTHTNGKYVIKVEQGEEVLSTLTRFCKEEGIENGILEGVGAVRSVSCGYYDLTEKQYHFTQYDEMVEVVSMQGNIALKDKEPFLHVHAVFTNTKNEAFGGHVEAMTVGVVLEVIVTPLSSSIEREYDQDIGLFLMNCGS